mmetsp:Transcript_46688/g.79595  ORF Transcript_46688/g.79595 Transcript_46688/m.79595 type:complete len:216 (+) Transcript_46688:35-682(+)
MLTFYLPLKINRNLRFVLFFSATFFWPELKMAEDSFEIVPREDAAATQCTPQNIDRTSIQNTDATLTASATPVVTTAAAPAPDVAAVAVAAAAAAAATATAAVVKVTTVFVAVTRVYQLHQASTGRPRGGCCLHFRVNGGDGGASDPAFNVAVAVANREANLLDLAAFLLVPCRDNRKVLQVLLSFVRDDRFVSDLKLLRRFLEKSCQRPHPLPR